LIKRFADCFEDHRNQELIEHPVANLLAQRINGLILGYEDLNDHGDLRCDPDLALSVGKFDLEGKNRRDPKDKGKALAAHATLSRLELSAQAPDDRYKKIVANPVAIEDFIIEQGVKSIPKKSKEIVIDFDATDAPLHGQQVGAYFRGYYRLYCYLPLFAFCGNIPLWAELRECKIDGCKGTVEALQKMIPANRKSFGKKVRIFLRGDGDFASEETMAWCESQPELYYCLGYSVNPSLKKAVAVPLWKLRQEATNDQGEVAESARRFTELRYRTKGSWSRERRVVAKLELLPGLPDKTNLRFIVTNSRGWLRWFMTMVFGVDAEGVVDGGEEFANERGGRCRYSGGDSKAAWTRYEGNNSGRYSQKSDDQILSLASLARRSPSGRRMRC